VSARPRTLAQAAAHDAYTRDFRDVDRAERELIARQRRARGVEADAPTVGLALSGGGIRSSTFSLGVLQALDQGGVFPRLDYLSTVSGGGFIGSALGWFLAHTRGRFPFAGHPAGRQQEVGPDGPRVGDFLRLHANYLDHRTPAADGKASAPTGGAARAPDGGFTLAGLLSVVGQQMLVTMLVYGGLMVVGFFVLHTLDSLLRPLKAILALQLHVEPSVVWIDHTNFMMLVGLGFLLLYVALAPYWSLRMFLASRLGRGRGDAAAGRLEEYALRMRMERVVSAVLLIGIFGVLIGTVPLVAEWVSTWVDQRWIRGGAFGLVATLGGAIGLFQNGAGDRGGRIGELLRSPLAIRLTAVVTLYALLLVSHTLAMAILYGRALWLVWALLGVVLAFGFWSDVNTLGSHRMYRDRLMETFLPDMEAVERGRWQPSLQATTHLIEDAATEAGPYHIFNAALTTVGSSDARYHARGADSFVMSPLFCGSTATGWRRASSWPRRRLTVPTCMAVSAAAVNPGAGSAGRGITTGWAVSTLLAFLNLRLGYWVDNPDPAMAPRGRRNRPGLLLAGSFPLALERTFPWIRARMPVLLSLLPHPLGPRQHERRPWVQLDDGGAFEATGLYELIRRRVDVILVTDATGDERYDFECMGDVVGRVWNDFGVNVRFDAQERSLGDLRPGSADVPPGPDGHVLSARAHTLGEIDYPAWNGQPAKTGALVLIKPSLVPGLPLDVLTYRATHPDFPNESTFNQFFNERQFEAYRQLGYFSARQMLEDPRFQRHVVERLPVAATPARGADALPAADA
jgi:hypothetical protein